MNNSRRHKPLASTTPPVLSSTPPANPSLTKQNKHTCFALPELKIEFTTSKASLSYIRTQLSGATLSAVSTASHRQHQSGWIITCSASSRTSPHTSVTPNMSLSHRPGYTPTTCPPIYCRRHCRVHQHRARCWRTSHHRLDRLPR
jgi:hypothetical protein